MGYGMARNVRQKIPKSSTLYVFDLNKAALEKFVAETKNDGPVEVCSSAKAVVDHAVRIYHLTFTENRIPSSPCYLKEHTSSLLISPPEPVVLPQPPSRRNSSLIAVQLTLLHLSKSVKLSPNLVWENSLTLQSLYSPL